MAENEKRKKGKWTEEAMKLALNEVISKKMTQRQASVTFSVPRTSLGDRLRAIQAGEAVDVTPQLGRFIKTFDECMEKQLVCYMKDLDNKFMTLNRKEFLKLAYDLAEHLKVPHQFNKVHKVAGKQFYYDFMARHPELSLRTPESTSLKRTLGFNKHQVNRFFKMYTELLREYNFSADRIHNCDETGFSIVHDYDVKVISQRGKKQVSKIISGDNVTILLCINAAGNTFVPPLFVFPNNMQIDEVLKKDAPPGSIFVAEESGWITAKAFLKFLELFVERSHPTKEEPVLLVLDGHSIHKDLEVIIFAKSHHVHMISLPPHTTHKMQPLDQAVMQPFKAAYKQACSVWMSKFLPLKIAQRDVAGLVNTAYTSICRMDLAQSAFACTGLWPLNSDVFTDLDIIPVGHLRVSEPVNDEPAPSTSVPQSGSAKPLTPTELNSTTLTASAVPILSAGIASPSAEFKKMIENMSPVAKPLEVKIKKRKQRTQQSDPYLFTIQKQLEDKIHEKNKLAEEKRLRAELRKSKQNLKKENVKQNLRKRIKRARKSGASKIKKGKRIQI